MGPRNTWSIRQLSEFLYQQPPHHKKRVRSRACRPKRTDVPGGWPLVALSGSSRRAMAEWLNGSMAEQPGTSSGGPAGPAGPADVSGAVAAASVAAMQQLQDLPGWQRLLDVIEAESKVAYRQVLSHHTSQPCQPQKRGGVVPCLRDSGLETNIGSRGLMQVRLELPSLFQKGVGPGWVYETAEHPSMKKAQQDACKTTLAFLLAVNPEAVHLAPGSMRDGGASIGRIRQAARDVGEWDTAAFWQEVRQHQARERPLPMKQMRPPVSDGAPGWEMVPTAEGRAVDALKTLRPGVIYRPDRLPQAVWQVLEEEVPKGGLRDFMRARPELFEVIDTPGVKGFEFRVQETRGETWLQIEDDASEFQ